MQNLYARAVFFVADAERSQRFYIDSLGMPVDWNFDSSQTRKPWIFQVNLLGFELIIEQGESDTRDRVGQGRVFIGLEDEQAEPLKKHLIEKKVKFVRRDWGRPTLVIKDLDGNELFFWLPHDDFSGLETTAAE